MKEKEMGRKPEPRRKDELLVAIVNYLFEHGLADLSLRPLATALEISPHALLYHFGSKEQMLVQALTEARKQERVLFAQWVQEQQNLAHTDPLQRLWGWLSSQQSSHFLRLFFEVYGLALQDPKRFRGFLEGVVSDWFPVIETELIRRGYAPHRIQALTTLIIATARGLLLDLLTTQDQARINEAYRELVDIMHQFTQEKEETFDASKRTA